MNKGTQIRVKCTYAELFNPVTKKVIFSLQKKATKGLPFATVVEDQGDYILAELNESATAHLYENMPTLRKLKSTFSPLVLVKPVAVTPAKTLQPPVYPSDEEPTPVPNPSIPGGNTVPEYDPEEEPEIIDPEPETKKTNPIIIWLLGAALLAAL